VATIPRQHERSADGTPIPATWPYVDRRRPADQVVPAPMVDPKRRKDPPWPTPPISPIRWLAILVSLVVASQQLIEPDPWMWVALGVALAYATFRSIKPIDYEAGRSATFALCFDTAIHTELVLLTGAWSSPFTFTLLPSIAQAGFARGSRFATKVAVAVVLMVSVPHIAVTQRVSSGVRDAALWGAVMVLVGVLSGFARQVSTESALQQTIAMDRLTRLAEANQLLFRLHQVSQNLPSSLDLEEVLDSAIARVCEVMPKAERVIVLLYEDSDKSWILARQHGLRGPQNIDTWKLAPPLHRARSAEHPVLEPVLEPPRTGLARDTRSGIYSPLRARGSLIGLLAVESTHPNDFAPVDVELVDGLIEPLGVAIDNARFFARIRSIGADEERARIARDLHDQIGQSLASLAFGLDRAIRVANKGGEVTPVLDELRGELRTTVRDVREALYDLRTDVSNSADLATTLALFLDRVAERSGLEVVYAPDVVGKLPLPQERELWWIAREAVVNVERHAHATKILVSWSVRPDLAVLDIVDDGVGFAAGSGRPDSYGMIGMRERASTIGARFDIESGPGKGTKVRVSVHPASGGIW
jgi:signal transduction histidine kinase